MPASGYVSADGTTIIPVSESNPLPTTATLTIDTVTAITTTNGAFTDRSGTITTGGTSQQIMAANATRKYLLVQNNDASNLEDIWINFGTAAAATSPSIRIPTGGAYELSQGLIPDTTVTIISATTGKKFTAKEG